MKSDAKVHKVVALGLGILNFYYISSFAQIIIVEMLFVTSFVIFLLSSKRANFKIIPEFRRIIVLGLLWLVAQASSDLLNDTNQVDSIKSLAQIFVLVSLFYWGYYWSIRNVTILRYYLFGYVISAIPQYFFLPGLFGSSDPWKFIFGPSVTLLLLLIIPGLGLSKLSASLVLLVLVCIDFAVGSRSLGLITLITIMMLLRIPLRQRGFVFILSFFTSVVFLMVGTYAIYESITLNGFFGQNQLQKFEKQSQAGPIFLVARSELIYEFQAIKQTGILGLGSSPQVDQNYLERVASLESNVGVNHPSTAAFIQYKQDGRIQSHSMILGAWMESGIFGALFWLYLTGLVISTIFNSTGREPIFGLVTRFLTINYLWAVFFSPLGAGSRMMTAITITLILQDKIRKS